MPWHDDPDELAGELNALAPATTAAPAVGRLEDWLRTLVARRGADLLLVAGSPPGVRIDGQVVWLDEPVLDGEAIDGAGQKRLRMPAIPPW